MKKKNWMNFNLGLDVRYISSSFVFLPLCYHLHWFPLSIKSYMCLYIFVHNKKMTVFTLFCVLPPWFLNNNRFKLFSSLYLAWAFVCLCVYVRVCVLLKGKKNGGCTMSPGPDTSVTIREGLRSVSCLTFYWLCSHHRSDTGRNCCTTAW